MIEVKVNGIPALADVTYYNPGFAGRGLSGEPKSYASMTAPEPEEVDFILHDRKGYFAPWLEVKLEDQKVFESVETQVLAAMRNA